MGEGGLRNVLVLEPASVRALLFPLTVIQALPRSSLPPLALGHNVVHGASDTRSAAKRIQQGDRTGKRRKSRAPKSRQVREGLKRTPRVGRRKRKGRTTKEQRPLIGKSAIRRRKSAKAGRSRIRRKASNTR
ncbi:hypothetical protein C0Q44_24280 [Paenibacillus sp. PCH8]|nr:hypothetical protein C0Q44_24280 [Paenibacillus sp. PCH8]